MRRLALLLILAVSLIPAITPAQSEVRKVNRTLTTVTTYQEDSSKARKLMQLGMSRQSTVNVRAIIAQRVDYDSDVFQQIKVEMSRSGKLHQLVLSPLSVQGIELVDDGSSTRTFTPDDKTLVIQPSARQSLDDVKFRMSLVDRNYTLKIDRRDKIAGRVAIVIEATPKEEGLETRCYSIDERTGFLLRLETCKDNAQPTLHFETKMVEFPAELSDDIFQLQASMGVYTKKFDHKCLSPNSKNLSKDVGFQPIIPGNLPLGFAIQEFQTNTDSSSPALAVKLTDGLAKATIYQWRRMSSRRVQDPAGTLVRDAGGLRLMIAGDVPDDVKRRLLESFLRAARSEKALNIPCVSLAWVQELGCAINVFPLDRDPEGIGPMIITAPALLRI